MRKIIWTRPPWLVFVNFPWRSTLWQTNIAGWNIPIFNRKYIFPFSTGPPFSSNRHVFYAPGVLVFRQVQHLTNVKEPSMNPEFFLGGEIAPGRDLKGKMYMHIYISLTHTYIYIYAWNLLGTLYFGGWTLQNKVFSNQNKGHLGSRYIHIMYIM